MRTRLGLAVVIPALVLAVAACGSKTGSDIATANGGGGGAKPAATGSLSSEERQQRALKFVECMREQGIDMPDPDAGEVRVGANAVNEGKMKAASEACRQYMPSGGEMQKPSSEQTEQLRKLAQCMREQGIENFPDPGPDGTLNLGGTGIDMQDAKLKAADEACKNLRPKPGSGS